MAQPHSDEARTLGDASNVTLYGAALEHFLYPAWERLRGHPTVELLALLERTQRASADEIEALRTK